MWPLSPCLHRCAVCVMSCCSSARTGTISHSSHILNDRANGYIKQQDLEKNLNAAKEIPGNKLDFHIIILLLLMHFCGAKCCILPAEKCECRVRGLLLE